MERHRIQNQLKEKLTGYWPERLFSQLSYLEEYVSANKLDKYDALLDDVCQSAKRIYDDEGTLGKTSVLSLEQKLSAASPELKATTISCIAHAHIDMNWMWRFDETVSVTIDTFRTMLDLMKEYPDFTFSQSQASVYQIIEEFAPEMLPEIKARIKEKRWEVVASTWVETDKNMPSGESLSRHILYTRSYLSKLLDLGEDDFRIDYEPDTFGHNLNVPEIMNQGGVKYYYHCRGYDKHHIYRWKSPSGAKITVFRDPTWYMDAINPSSFLYVPDFCVKNKLDRMIHVYGVGDHGGGATRRDLDRIIDMNSWPCYPTIKFGRYIDFFRYIENLDLPEVDHELNFIFSGCYTSQSRIKMANRIAEATLGEAEAFGAISELIGGYRYNAGAFADAWENVLFSHFHDILPGSGVTDTREYALGMFQRTMAAAGTRKSAAIRSIAANLNTRFMLPEDDFLPDSVSEGAGVGFGVGDFQFTSAGHTRGISRLFSIFSSAGTVNRLPSVITVWDWQGNMNKVKLTDENGQPVEFQLLDDKLQHYWGHRYFRLAVDAEVQAFGYRTLLLTESDTRSCFSVPNDPRTDKPPVYIMENEFLKAEFDVHNAGLISLVDKASGKELVKGSDKGGVFRYIEEDDSAGMTAWWVGRYMNVIPIVDSVRVTSDVSGSLIKSMSYEVPFKNSSLTVKISLPKNSPVLEFKVDCRWRELGIHKKFVPQLNFSVPLNFEAKKYEYDIPFGVIERDEIRYDVPAQSFSCVRNGDTALMLVTDTKYGFRGFENEMSVDLIRGSYGPDSTPEVCDHSFRFGIGVLTNPDAKALLSTSYIFCHPNVTVDVKAQDGKLPVTGSFFGITGDVMVSAIKLAEDGSGDLIVRGYEPNGCTTRAVIKTLFTPSAACVTDTHEQPLAHSSAVIEGDSVILPVNANASFTVRIKK